MQIRQTITYLTEYIICMIRIRQSTDDRIDDRAKTAEKKTNTDNYYTV